MSYIQARNEAIPKKEDVIKEVTLASTISDRNGTLLMRFHDDLSNRDLIQTEEITDEIRIAFLAAEDAEFYNHMGVNIQAISRCFYEQVSSDVSCGASTITQQVVKVQTGRNELTVERKIDEALTAIQLEQESTKDEILTQYLNITPYGSNVVGIKTAAKLYFDIEDLSNLTLDQSVTLAAIINDPVNLSPIFSTNPEKSTYDLKNRRAYIYDQLEDKKELLNKQLSDLDSTYVIKTEELIVSESKPFRMNTQLDSNSIKAGHFVTYVLDELQSKNYYNNERAFTLAELQSGGFEIETTLDYDLQKVAEKYAQIGGDTNKKWNVNNAALLTTIPSTGEIITMAGSKNYDGTSEGCDQYGENCTYDPKVNVLTTLQQPGSTNKPLAYYMAYASGKLAPGSFLPDIPIEFNGYVPKNWDNSFLGVKNTTAREMLRQSRNIPALIVISSLGYDNYIETSRQFGYTSYGNVSNYGPSVVLGGADVYPIEHAQGYGVFANQGDLIKLNPIKKITDSNGNIIYESKIEATKVADPAAAYLLNKNLENLDTGIGESVSWDGRAVAGKTGTTENNIESLLVIYSPDFVTIGWAGNNNNQNLDQNYGWPAYIVAPWLKSYMSEIGNTTYFAARSEFQNPGNVAYGGNGLAQDLYITDRLTNWGVDANNKFSLIAPELQKYLDIYLAQAKK